MIHVLDRKRFVQTLGVAGIGLGLLAGAASAPSALAQESHAPGTERLLFHDEGDIDDLSEAEMKELLIQLLQERAEMNLGDIDANDLNNERPHRSNNGDYESLRTEAYREFTQALADELGIDDADAVDAAIRNAMIAMVNANDGLTREGAEEQKALIAVADVPIGPAYRGHGG